MSEPNRFALRPLDFGEILDHSFRFYFRSWKPLLTIGAVTAAPGVIMNGFMQSFNVDLMANPTNNWLFRMIEAADQGDFSGIFTLIGLWLLGGLFYLLVWPLISGTLIALCARLYLGQPTTLGDAFRIAGRRYWALLGTGALFVVMAIVAFPVLVIGGLVILSPITLTGGYMALCTFLAFRNYAIVVEGAGGGMPAFRRSYALVKGRFWPLLGLGIVFSLMVGVLGSLINYVVVLPLSFVQMFWAHSAILGWVMALLSGVGMAAVAPMSTVGLTLTYYDARVRREGLDLEMQAQGQQP